MKIITLISLCFALTLHAETPEWSQAIQIFARITPPQFPARDFVITRFGAVAGGSKPPAHCRGASKAGQIV
jgi:hypothetical protein